jgi:hypothetical protein
LITSDGTAFKLLLTLPLIDGHASPSLSTVIRSRFQVLSSAYTRWRPGGTPNGRKCSFSSMRV